MILTFPPKPKIQLKKICVALTELSPCGVKELRRELVLEHHMELVNKDMGALALLPVQRHAVEHGVRDHQQAGGLKLGTETVNVEHHDTLIEVHIGLLAEDVQRTGGIELKGQRDLLRFRLRLLQQHIA